jgi:hypothetical protein
MAKIGIERLGTGHDQEDSSKREQADDSVIGDKGHAMRRIEGAQYGRILCHVPNAGCS